MEKKTPWQESLDLTLDEQVRILERVLSGTEVSLSLGEMWMQKKSDGSFIVLRALVALSSWQKRATGALSQLQYWMANNGYATTLTTQQVLTSWSGGSVMLTELIEATFLCLFYEDLIDTLEPDMATQVAEMYAA